MGLFTNPMKKEALHLREFLCKSYPSNMSYRCQLIYPMESMQSGTIVYLVAEGNYIYLVSEMNMEAKYQIPISKIRDMRMYNNFMPLAEASVMSTEHNQAMATTVSMVCISIEYVDKNLKDVILQLPLGRDGLSHEYNMICLGTIKDPVLYVRKTIEQYK